MRAVLSKKPGPPETLVIEDVPSPQPGPDDILLSVKACGVNFPDLLIIEDKYQFKPERPFSPGGEVAGIVKEVGSNVKHVKPGDRVIGSSPFGGFAEEVVFNATNVIAIPDSMDFPTASAFILTYGTSHHALKDRAKIRPGETLLVLGAAGGVGIAAVEIGKAMGARVIAAASTEDKVQVAKDHGADDGFVYPKGPLDKAQQKALSDKIKELTDGKGADVVYDPVGGDFSEPALRATAWQGRFLVVGFAAGDIPKIPLNLALLKGCDILGVFWGSFTSREPETHQAHVKELLTWFDEGKVKPHISETFPLDKAEDALKHLAARKAKGKVVLVME